MKHFFTFLFLGLAGISIAQGQAKRTYLVMYDKQINADSLSAVFRANRTSADERSRITLTALKQISQSSGMDVEAFLEEKMADKSGTQISYTKLWLVNGLALEAPSSVASQVAAYAHVQLVEDISQVKAYGIEPTRMQEDVNRAVGAPEPGLLAVGVRFLWDLGYTGKGLKLMSFDTGIWPSHPALGGRFYGEYMPLHLAWNGIFSATPVDKSSSHGTHTIGTMSGLDTLTHDTLGLAFKAYSMSTDPIVSNLPDTIGMANIMIAYQWVLDPDGNPNTTDDMPAVICNSWGTSGNSGFCESFVTTMLENIDLTGIANEYSAGNNGPGASTIGVPAIIATGLVNAFAVGAVDGNNPLYPIASFSSHGPTACADSGSLQIKPEVVAPGVNVRSCVKLNEYAFYDGTSMAGPHAAGLLLLLKEAFPTVAGETLKEALYYSAVDLGAPGEDNTFGMGMINAQAAYNWLVNEGYTPVPPASNVPELMLEKDPVGMTDLVCGSPVSNTLHIYNEGTIAINDSIHFKAVLNGNVSAQWTQFISLAPQQRIDINNPLVINPTVGANELWVSAHQKNTPVEKDLINNNRTTRFTYYEEKTVPYLEDFETDTFKLHQWTVVNPDMNRTFDLITTAGQQSGTKSAAIRFVLYPILGYQKDYLISPPVKLNPTGNHKVAFDIAYQKRTQTQKDTVSLLASLDCGLTFDQVIFVGSPDEMVTLTATTPTNFTPSLPEHWKRLTFDIPNTWNDETVLFAFRSVNAKGANAFMDDFSVFIGYDPLAVNEYNNINLDVFPNPFTNEINVRLEQEASAVALNVYDLSGRAVASKNVSNQQNITWDLGENLPAGIYFLKINVGNTQQVYKIIKN